MLRRIGPHLLLLLTSLAAGVAVARLPPDVATQVVTRRHHGGDPLLSAALLRFSVNSLLEHPTRYFQPPILFPDRNPLRGTEPLVSEALLAVPFRLVLGDRPPPVYTSVKIATLALLAFATGLLLRELGVRTALCLVAAALGVMVGTTTIFADRLQALSLPWLPLGLVYALRYWRRGRALDLAGFGACLFLTVQASLYTAVMLLALAPFLAPLLRPLWRARDARRRLPALAGAVLLSAVACLAVLRPYLADRADVAAYSTATYAEEKSWNPATLVDPVTSPPEYPPSWARLAPEIGWDGAYPGTAFVLLVSALVALAALDRLRGQGTDAPSGEPGRRSRQVAGSALALLAVTLGLWALGASSRVLPLVATAALWTALGAWCWRLLTSAPPRREDAELRMVASACGLAALVLFVLGLGSPVRLHLYGAPLFDGLFQPLSTLLPPLREMRELKRCLLPAGWAAVVAATVALELRLRAWPSRLGTALATVLLAVAFLERADADVRKATAPAVPEGYALLRQSSGTGGLLELPFDEWGQIASIHRMLWQPSHGRPIVAGKTGLDPAWYAPARAVFNGFPSDESLALLRAWGIDSVLDTRGGAEPSWPQGVEQRGSLAGPRGVEWRLLDVPGDDARPLEEPAVPEGSWGRAVPTTTGTGAGASPALDGSLDTAADVSQPEGLQVGVPAGQRVVAVALDLGSGRFGRVPPTLRVLGRAGEEWLDMTEPPSAAHLRARAADQLLRTRHASLVIRLRPGAARELRLVADEPWDLPELRLRLVPEAPSLSGQR